MTIHSGPSTSSVTAVGSSHLGFSVETLTALRGTLTACFLSRFFETGTAPPGVERWGQEYPCARTASHARLGAYRPTLLMAPRPRPVPLTHHGKPRRRGNARR